MLSKPSWNYSVSSDRGQVIQLRIDTLAMGEFICPIRKFHSQKENAHFDHEPPNTFDKSVTDFINDKQLDIAKVQLKHGDNDAGSTFVDKSFDTEPLIFHIGRGKLRVICEQANSERSEAQGVKLKE